MLDRLPVTSPCSQTLQECQCQKLHRLHFGCRYQIQNCIACLKTLLLLIFAAVLQAKDTVTSANSGQPSVNPGASALSKNTGIEGAKLNAKDCHIQLSEKAARSAIWGGLAGQKHSDAAWF